jgi:hypothetical protein
MMKLKKKMSNNKKDFNPHQYSKFMIWVIRLEVKKDLKYKMQLKE